MNLLNFIIKMVLLNLFYNIEDNGNKFSKFYLF